VARRTQHLDRPWVSGDVTGKLYDLGVHVD
jgi:hypothetical protein